jgi:hypothetical protein
VTDYEHDPPDLFARRGSSATNTEDLAGMATRNDVEVTTLEKLQSRMVMVHRGHTTFHDEHLGLHVFFDFQLQVGS